MQSALDTLGKGDEWYAKRGGRVVLAGQLDYFPSGTSLWTPAPRLPSSL
jgi:hypothetical protein